MTSACFSRGHTGFSRNATLVATVNPPALAGGVFNFSIYFCVAIVPIIMIATTVIIVKTTCVEKRLMAGLALFRETV